MRAHRGSRDGRTIGKISRYFNEVRDNLLSAWKAASTDHSTILSPPRVTA